jgi:uncharacterized protein (DUF924 family)
MIAAEDILKFWFEETDKKHWFNATDAFDAEIRSRFETKAVNLASSLLMAQPHLWEATPEGSLALILAMDQFPRNMYRGTPGAFAWDDLALSVAQRMVVDFVDLKIPQERRAFIYMPFMHSENLDMQDKCVELCDSRLEDENTLFHARAHRKLIEEFGRFPHRNEILGRENTKAEEIHLKSGGYSP